jgi:hypothetical protein
VCGWGQFNEREEILHRCQNNEKKKVEGKPERTRPMILFEKILGAQYSICSYSRASKAAKSCALAWV